MNNKRLKGVGNHMRQDNKVFCNKCGKTFKEHNGVIQEGIFNVEYLWGFFSNKDGEIDSFDICEKCYNKIIEDFAIPITREESNEMI